MSESGLSGPEKLSSDHELSGFDSGEPTLDDWLRRRALQNEGRGGSRTYTVCDGRRVAGYYSLAAGAVAHAVKAIAGDRQWRHGSHNLRREIMDLIAAEFNRPELGHLQAVADRLHDNFYEDPFQDWQLKERLDTVTGLLESLMELRNLGINPDFVPSMEQQRSIDRLRLTEEEARANASIDFPPPMPPLDLPGY